MRIPPVSFAFGGLSLCPGMKKTRPGVSTRTVHAAHDANDSAEHFDFDMISQTEQALRTGDAGTDEECPILQRARGTESIPVSQFEDVDRLRPDRGGQGWSRCFALAIDRKKRGILQIRMAVMSGRSRPKQVADGRLGQPENGGQSAPQKERYFFELILDGVQEGRRRARRRLRVRSF